jgi:lysophospholipase L1-like esterase
MKKTFIFTLLGGLLILGSVTLHYTFKMEKFEVDRLQFKDNINTLKLVLQDLGNLYATTKRGILLTQLSTVEDATILAFGDSIVEQMYFPLVNGKEVFNAGICGAQATESRVFFNAALDQSKFLLIVLSIGSNDAIRKLAVDPQEFIAAYRALADLAQQRNIPVVLATIPPLETSKKGAELFDPERIEAFNNGIKALGQERDLPVVDINAIIREKNAQRLDAFTVDGVHLNGVYARFWREAVYAAIRSSLAGKKDPAEAISPS